MPAANVYQRLANFLETHKYDDVQLDVKQKELCIIALRNYKNFQKRMPKK